MLKRPLSKAQPPETTKPATAEATKSAEIASSRKCDIEAKPKAARTVTARYPHHVWHIDLSLLPIVTRFWTPWLVIVPLRISVMQREMIAYMFWYNQHRPHRGLDGRTPAELRDGLIAAIDKPMEERSMDPLYQSVHRH